MKKFLSVLGICILLIVMPATLTISASTTKLVQRNTNIFTKKQLVIEKTPSPNDEPPGWANGNFSGVWGIDIWGQAHIPLGWLFGYYKRHINFGYFYGAFDWFWGKNESYLKGWLFGPYMFGSLGINESANETLFVGIGGCNETHFHWRVMGLEGPVFFMHGEYTKFKS